MLALRRTWAWWLTGLAFTLYPVLRPWSDAALPTDPLAGFAAMASGRWVAAHLLGMLGFALLPVALASLGGAAPGLRPRLLTGARVLAYVGAAAVLPYYGGEAFGLHAVGAYATAAGDPRLAGLVDGFRYQPVALTLFGVGLVATAAAGVLAWLATAGRPVAWRLASAAFGLALVLYLPQFFGGPALRITHGLLVGAACWALGVLLVRAQGSSTSLPRTWPERLVA